MRAVISVSFPQEMAKELDRIAKASGRTKSDLIKDALRAYLWEDRFSRLRSGLSRKAKDKGLVTDEDIFKAVS
ncbi:MAG: ribbon-helix-helix protein, CopG family [Candidatus Aminicenantales bacterium]|jgi:CopG family transcriptional regulator/antitoxin EndoAI